jgi:5-methylcytosine-specific restriction endonuclease McrA
MIGNVQHTKNGKSGHAAAKGGRAVSKHSGRSMPAPKTGPIGLGDRLHRPVLVLNASFEPINICAARRALVLILKGIASAEEHVPLPINSARATLQLPSVIRLLEYRRIPHQTRALSRKNIMMRDKYQCQYCHKIFPSGELTLDHVLPRSRGGETTWENLVACCHPCNNRKGARTPEEAHMKLLKQPKPFSLHTSRHLMRLLGKSDDQWRKYLFF